MPDQRIRGEEVRFRLTYAGPAVDAGRMDAQTLGSAMLSMSQLLETGASLTFGADVQIDVQVVADFKQGSFAYDVVTLAMGMPDLVSQLARSFSMNDVLVILGVGGGGGGLIGFLRWLKKRPIASVEQIGNGNSQVTTRDGDSTIINAQTVYYFNNSRVRTELEGVVSPLRRDGISEFRWGRGSAAEATISADEVGYFDAPVPEGETLQDKTSVEIVQIEGLTFLPGRKWRFRLPDGTGFNSSVDDRFGRDVLQHTVVFGAGDALEVDLQTRVIRDAGGVLHAQREIVRVIRLLPAPKQLNLGPGGRPGDEK